MDRLLDALDRFRCCKDIDIERFLRKDACEYLRRKWCSIYLVVNEEAFDSGYVEAEAYFTLSHKSLIPEYASKTAISKVSGGFKEPDTVHFVLIGQLGKYISENSPGEYSCADIRGSEILDYAFEVIRESSSLIVCRCVLVECNDNPKVHKFYTDYHFSKFQYDGEHYQFYKRID